MSSTLRSIGDEYPLEDDGICHPPDTIGRLMLQILDMIHALEDEKEVIPLLGQEVEKLKIALPEWVALKG